MRRTKRINWVSEVQSDIGRRALLITTFPVFIALNIVAALTNIFLYFAILSTWGLFKTVRRSTRILMRSFALRWSNAKPRGHDDWVSRVMDIYEAQP